MLEGPHIVLALFVVVHPDAVGSLVPVALALEHRIQPLAAAHDDIVTNLGPAEPEHLLLHDATGEGAVRVELSTQPLYMAPLLHLEGTIQCWVAKSSQMEPKVAKNSQK